MERFLHDAETGEITQGGVRYLLMRPDVLMGIGACLGAYGDFVGAMSQSAYANARQSFERYRDAGLFDGEEPLQQTCEIAATLGWGVWSPLRLSDREVLLLVRNSPFAQAAPRGSEPVCGPIVGVLRALYLAVEGEDVDVQETSCSAQGDELCRFQIRTGRSRST